MDTWDERIVMVADDEDFLDWQRDWLAETVAADRQGSEALCATTLANRVHGSHTRPYGTVRCCSNRGRRHGTRDF
jgi:hypothetical protein